MLTVVPIVIIVIVMGKINLFVKAVNQDILNQEIINVINVIILNVLLALAIKHVIYLVIVAVELATLVGLV